MNRNLENLLQQIFLAVINKNMERAERLIGQAPQDAIEKLAYSGDELLQLSLRILPAGAGAAIKKNIEEKAASTAA
jgi:hypothetical protein